MTQIRPGGIMRRTVSRVGRRRVGPQASLVGLRRVSRRVAVWTDAGRSCLLVALAVLATGFLAGPGSSVAAADAPTVGTPSWWTGTATPGATLAPTGLALLGTV